MTSAILRTRLQAEVHKLQVWTSPRAEADEASPRGGVLRLPRLRSVTTAIEYWIGGVVYPT